MRPAKHILMACLLAISCAVHATTIEEVVTSPTTFAVCKTVDVATTIHLLSTGAGVEANPLVAGVIKAGGYVPLVAISVGIYYLLRYADNPAATGIVNVVTCGAAVNNLGVILH